MKTIKPITMLSNNTDTFLIKTLNNLIENGYIEFWAYIQHQPEEFEIKPHKHLYIIPKKPIDTFSIQKKFDEYDIHHIDLPPLNSIGSQKMKFKDWYMYALNDEKFFIKRGHDIKIKHHYVKDEIKCSNYDYLNMLIDTMN